MENKNTILTIILAIGLVLISLFLIYQTKVEEIKTIAITGSYSTKVDPDQAEITFNLITRADTILEAQQMNLELANNLIKVLLEDGMTEKEIQTINYYTNKRTVWENNKYVDKDFQVINSMQIKTKNIDKIGKYIDLASKNGVENINNLQFTLSEEKKEEIYQEALAKAGENARERAKKLGLSVSFKIKGIKSISLETPITPYYRYYNTDMLTAESTAKREETPIQPEQVNINANVNVVFKIEDLKMVLLK